MKHVRNVFKRGSLVWTKIKGQNQQERMLLWSSPRPGDCAMNGYVKNGMFAMILHEENIASVTVFEDDVTWYMLLVDGRIGWVSEHNIVGVA